MTVVSCPLCWARVNALAAHCPECGADPGLPPERARADLLARGLSVPTGAPSGGPTQRRRWLWWWSLLAAAAVWMFVQLTLSTRTPRGVSYREVVVWAAVGLVLLIVTALALVFGRRSWSLRRRLGLVALALFVTLALLAPLGAGFLGPEAAVYATEWRPWRTDLSVRPHYIEPGHRDDRIELAASFYDHWPSDWQGEQAPFVVVERPRSWLPWIVTGHYSGG